MKKIVSVFLTMFLFTSCHEILNVSPKDFLSPQTYYDTENQLNTALTGIYSILGRNELYGDFMLGRLGLDADEGWNYYDENTVGYYAVSTSDAKITGYWNVLYEGINRANVLLDNIHKPVMDDIKRKDIEGQALFLRSYYYFMLVVRFGDVPLILKPVTTGNAEEVQTPRIPAKEVYEQVVKDMTTSADLIMDAAGHPGRVTRSAVWGILARVCLNMAGNPINDITKYQDASSWAYKVISSEKHELNPSYEQVFINYAQDIYDFKESIWEVEFWGNGDGIYSGAAGRVGRNNGIPQTADADVGYATGTVRPTAYLHNLYAAEDLRKNWVIAPFYYTGNPATKVSWTGVVYRLSCSKFRREYELLKPKNNTWTPQNYPILRYSDVLLMYAEAENALGRNLSSTEPHVQAVNNVRRRAYGKYLNGEGVKSITIVSPGTGYTTVPIVTISGGGGSGATAIATISGGGIASITVTNKGKFYTSTPTIAITGGNGSGATATVMLTEITDADLGVGYLASSTLFLKAIQEERARELCFENLRKDDLIRWGIFYERMKASLADVPNGTGKIYTAPKTIYTNATARDVLWPIPLSEMNVNRKLVQNEGW
ncbi:RagB/SusD family nutrient uptake outer membrane protein [Pseudopedobacter beijingensis]|uniref:RagB/SusD family nutrient uptake outer membrane protein n=1 Tax=Pseudopedobacter beijingensis TaxID=1207056 RepID=A0ABW4IHE4_9SPHI